MRGRVAASVAIGACTLLAPSPARADDIAGDMRSYYDGEKLSAYGFGGFGVVAAGVGGFALTRDGDFAKGLGVSLIALGGLEAIGGAYYAFAVDAEIDRYSSLLARDPAAFRRDELAHIHGTTSRFVAYQIFEASLALAGVAAASYGFATDRDGWKGAGIGVTAVALPLFVVDWVNNRRAAHYEERLRAFQATLAPISAPGALGAAVRGTF
jgi:hypothetical protein